MGMDRLGRGLVGRRQSGSVGEGWRQGCRRLVGLWAGEAEASRDAVASGALQRCAGPSRDDLLVQTRACLQWGGREGSSLSRRLGFEPRPSRRAFGLLRRHSALAAFGPPAAFEFPFPFVITRQSHPRLQAVRYAAASSAMLCWENVSHSCEGCEGCSRYYKLVS